MNVEESSRVGLVERLAAAAPLDLLAVGAATLLADAVVLSGSQDQVQLAVAVPLLFFLPGYAVVAALYPESVDVDAPGRRTAGIALGERLALSFGVSLALLPALALGLGAVGAWVSPPAVAGALTFVVGLGAVVGTSRRLVRPPSRRFEFPFGRWTDALRRGLGAGTPAGDRLLNALLAVAVVLAAASLGYGLLAPGSGEQYTDAALLTQSEGELVAAGYPTDLAAGETAELVLELANHEGTDRSYTVVVRAERVQTDDDGVAVADAVVLDRLSVEVAAGETRTVPHEVATDLTGDPIRLSYYVYLGDAPDSPGPGSAYRHLYLWIDVGS